MYQFTSQRLLYKDSPFVPVTFPEDLVEIKERVKIQKISYLSSILEQVGHIGHALNVLHEHEAIWIINSFGCTSTDIANFYIGFSTPTILIYAGITMKFTTPEKIAQVLTIPTKIKTLEDHNRYKIQVLNDVSRQINKSNHPQSTIKAVGEILLKQKPFNNDEYYLAGVESCIFTMLTLCDQITKSKPC